MKQILMASPEFFDVIYEINPWMSGNIGKIDKQKAKKQWLDLKDLLEKKGIIVHVQKYIPKIECPDMVFTANHGIVIKDTFIAANFLKKERKLEIPYIVPTILEKGNFNKYDQCPYPWEGEAELFHYKENLYIGGYGQRATKKALIWFEKEYGIEIIKLKITNPSFYHLDTCFTIRNNKIFLYPNAFSKKTLSQLKEKVGIKNIYEVEKDIAFSFALNCIQLDNCAIIGTENTQIIKKLSEIFKCKVVGTEMSEFIYSGGSCFCSKLWLKNNI